MVGRRSEIETAQRAGIDVEEASLEQETRRLAPALTQTNSGMRSIPGLISGFFRGGASGFAFS